MMKKNEPIETEYAGVKFRSRTEARWAVFFDALGMRWEHEPEAFELSVGGRYLPDFWLPDFEGGAFVEVKRPGGDFWKARRFAGDRLGKILLCDGNPDFAREWVLLLEGGAERRLSLPDNADEAKDIVRGRRWWEPRAKSLLPPPLKPEPGPGRRGGPDPLECRYVAIVLRLPGLLAGDSQAAWADFRDEGLRGLVANASTHGPEDALHGAPEGARAAVEGALQDIPDESGALESLFGAVCQRLKLRRVEEQLAYIAKVTGRLDGAGDLAEDARELIRERADLLNLKKRLLEETV
jgi:hypothetical protein